MYTLFDNKVKNHGAPMLLQDHDLAKQEIKLFMQLQAPRELNPIEFDLFYLGQFDTETGKMYPLEMPEHLVNLKTIEDVETKRKEIQLKAKIVFDKKVKQEMAKKLKAEKAKLKKKAQQT